jgi:hypothetical protein
MTVAHNGSSKTKIYRTNSTYCTVPSLGEEKDQDETVCHVSSSCLPSQESSKKEINEKWRVLATLRRDFFPWIFKRLQKTKAAKQWTDHNQKNNRTEVKCSPLRKDLCMYCLHGSNRQKYTKPCPFDLNHFTGFTSVT